MSGTGEPEESPAGFEVGYGKPPVHTRFRKGQSGNPRGRPRRSGARAADIALNEAYRMVNVKEGNNIVRLPAYQAIVRSQIALAAKGNGPAQRAVIELTRAIEAEAAAAAEIAKNNEPQPKEVSNLEVARALLYVISGADYESRKSNA